MIPRSEYDRLLNDKKRYLGRRHTRSPKKGGQP